MENFEKQFAAAQAEIERQMARWYQRFATNNEIDLAEAKRMLNSKELKEFHWTVAEYIAYGEQNAIDGAWMKQLENASARVHISRLEDLKLQLQQQAEVLYSNQLDYVDAAARKMYEGSYYHTAFELQKGLGVGWTMQAINEETITKVLSRPWTTDNQTFRDRCWTNKQSLVNSVNAQLTQMVIRGEAPDRAISAISKQFDVSKAKAGRLVMTESAYFSSAGQKDCYKALDVERYKIVASFDKDTCSLCADMDGKVFKMSDYQVGLTAPPFHPWCRCCTCPYFEDMDGMDALSERLAEADVVASFMPSTPETRGLANAEFFAAMKPGAFFANGGRGDLVVADDLVAALESGHLAGAAVDVTDPEPLPATSPLWDAPNMLITPHVSGWFHLAATLNNVVDIAAENLRHLQAGETLRCWIEH